MPHQSPLKFLSLMAKKKTVDKTQRIDSDELIFGDYCILKYGGAESYINDLEIFRKISENQNKRASDGQQKVP